MSADIKFLIFSIAFIAIWTAIYRSLQRGPKESPDDKHQDKLRPNPVGTLIYSFFLSWIVPIAALAIYAMFIPSPTKNESKQEAMSEISAAEVVNRLRGEFPADVVTLTKNGVATPLVPDGPAVGKFYKLSFGDLKTHTVTAGTSGRKVKHEIPEAEFEGTDVEGKAYSFVLSFTYPSDDLTIQSAVFSRVMTEIYSEQTWSSEFNSVIERIETTQTNSKYINDGRLFDQLGPIEYRYSEQLKNLTLFLPLKNLRKTGLSH